MAKMLADQLVNHWPEVVQALAAVIALFLSVFVPIRIRNLDRRVAKEERLQKANALAFFILDVFEIFNEAIRGQAFLEVSDGQPSFPRQVVLAQLTINSAQRLQPVAERLWLFERKCGDAVNRAISYAIYFNRKVVDYFSADDVPLASLKMFHSIYGATLKNAKDIANEAVSLLEKQYDLSIRSSS